MVYLCVYSNFLTNVNQPYISQKGILFSSLNVSFCMYTHSFNETMFLQRPFKHVNLKQVCIQFVPKCTLYVLMYSLICMCIYNVLKVSRFSVKGPFHYIYYM